MAVVRAKKFVKICITLHDDDDDYVLFGRGGVRSASEYMQFPGRGAIWRRPINVLNE